MENVRDFFENEKKKGLSKSLEIIPRTAEATGVSEMSVKRIHKEYLAQDCKFLTSVKRYSISRIHVNPDSFIELPSRGLSIGSTTGESTLQYQG